MLQLIEITETIAPTLDFLLDITKEVIALLIVKRISQAQD